MRLALGAIWPTLVGAFWGPIVTDYPGSGAASGG